MRTCIYLYVIYKHTFTYTQYGHIPVNLSVALVVGKSISVSSRELLPYCDTSIGSTCSNKKIEINKVEPILLHYHIYIYVV